MDRADTIGWLAADVEQSLRRIAIVYRVVVIVWSAVLVVSGVLTEIDIPRLWVPLVGLAVMVGWAAFLVWANRTEPGLLRSPAVIGVDVLLAAVALYVTWMAGNTSTFQFSGGYPLSAVALAVAASGPTAGAMAGGSLLAAVLIRRFVAFGDPNLGNVVSEIMVWVFPTLLFIWAATVIRSFDRRRRAAEEALATARAGRARLEEREELAAHLHDSVLQTLALIQRQPDVAVEVAALARRQERELRAWLYGARSDPVESLRAAIEEMCGQIEDRHPIAVELVTAGDTGMSEHVLALIEAAREALVNAANHSGSGAVSVFAEVADGSARIFVRDRGVGYDPDEVPPDRRGVRDSIMKRMDRHGGTAEIRSAPGAGTEVRLALPLGAQ